MSDESAAERKGAEWLEANRRYRAFLAERIPELHEQGKPPPEYDDEGRVKSGRVGDFPGRRAREWADLEWSREGK